MVVALLDMIRDLCVLNLGSSVIPRRDIVVDIMGLLEDPNCRFAPVLQSLLNMISFIGPEAFEKVYPDTVERLMTGLSRLLDRPEPRGGFLNFMQFSAAGSNCSFSVLNLRRSAQRHFRFRDLSSLSSSSLAPDGRDEFWPQELLSANGRGVLHRIPLRDYRLLIQWYLHHLKHEIWYGWFLPSFLPSWRSTHA